MTNMDDIHAIAEDILRYSMGDARIQECVEEMLKRIDAEWNALMAEVHDAQYVEIADPTCEVCGRSSPTTWCRGCIENDTDRFWDIQNDRTRS